ncbi:asparaginase-domain-containing protein [Mrakia frigida]|uniref:asparaginase ASP1 n=1 Tax=Mrakia frigida TaxID=29902 RepID=UPI003FCBF024
MAALQDDSKVLILYAGGTIGMLQSDVGYVPEPGFLTATLKAQSRFHDPTRSSLHSHTQSSSAFLSWSSSASNPSSSRPTTPPNHNHQQSYKPFDDALAFTVKASLADEESEVEGEVLHDGEDGVRYRESRVEGLVTPPVDKGGRRVRYCVLEYSPLIDSSNVCSSDWIRLAADISLNYASFDGFLILHGTDTMAFSASALSFLLEDLGKPVIFTGAQIPLSSLRSDGFANLLGGLIISGTFPTLPEVGLFFNGTVWRGNRTRKISNEGFDAFEGEGGGVGALITVGIHMEVNWGQIIRPRALSPFKAHRGMCTDVAILRIFPGISAAFFRSFLFSASPPLKGVVLETFGAGNAPEREDIMAELRKATSEMGIVIVNITQCPEGFVSKAYSGGWALEKAGVVAGGDMTTECALTKLSYLLSKPNISISQVHHLIGASLRGEISSPPSTNDTSSPEPAIESLERLQDLLLQASRLSEPHPSSSTVTVTVPLPPIPSDFATLPSSTNPVHPASRTVAAWAQPSKSAAILESALLPHLLTSAVKNGDAALLSSLLDEHASPKMGSPGAVSTERNPANGINEVGMSLLHVAAIHGKEAVVKVLLERGAMVHVRDLLGHTPLYYAARQGHDETAKVLREAGAMFAGSDVEGGFVELGKRKKTEDVDDQLSGGIWD